MRFNWIPGYKGKYSLTREGVVYSHEKRWGSTKPMPRKSVLGKNGYYCVSLYKNNKEDRQYIHRLLALMFIPNKKNKTFVNHKDGVKTNNELSNLEWCTQKENNRHAYDSGLGYHFIPRHGENTTFAKLTGQSVRSIRQSTEKNSVLAKKYNVTPTNIRYIKKRKTWKHII